MTDPPARLAVTVVSTSTGLWGTERSVLGLAPHLRALGIDLTIASPAGGPFAAAAAAAGLRTVGFALDERGGARTTPVRDRLRDVARLPRGVARVVRATRGADVVHSNNLLIHADAVLAGRLTRRPTVLELHDIVAPGSPALAQSAAVALSAATVAISSAVLAPVRGRGRRRVTVVPQAVDLDAFTPGPPDPAWRSRVAAPVVVGIVGRIDPVKGIDVLLRAAAGVPDVGVLVVGSPSLDSGAYLDELLALGRREVDDRFHHVGPVPLDRIPDLLRSLDVLVNASDAEPFGLSVLEAQACGTAVIGTAAGGLVDFVDDGRTGLLVPPRDPPALAAALTRLAHDADLRERLAGHALARARAEYGVATRAARLAAIYRSVARPGAGRTPR